MSTIPCSIRFSYVRPFFTRAHLTAWYWTLQRGGEIIYGQQYLLIGLLSKTVCVPISFETDCMCNYSNQLICICIFVTEKPLQGSVNKVNQLYELRSLAPNVPVIALTATATLLTKECILSILCIVLKLGRVQTS